MVNHRFTNAKPTRGLLYTRGDWLHIYHLGQTKTDIRQQDKTNLHQDTSTFVMVPQTGPQKESISTFRASWGV